MGPIINPQAGLAGTESWQVWSTCSHVKNEEVNIPGSTNIDKRPTTGVSESGLLVQKGTLDQTACADQGEPKREMIGHNEPSHGEISSNKSSEAGEPRSEDRQTERANAVLSSDRNEHDPCSEGVAVTSLSKTEDCEPSEPLKDSGKGDSFESVESKVIRCPEGQKRRQQIEKPFLDKKNSCDKFVWNKYLLQEFEGSVHPDWILHIVNGFVGQSGILLFHQSIFLVENATIIFAPFLV